MKKTKIICTMGPNTNDESLMRKLVQNGMDIARFNFSHGDHEEQKGRMDMLKNCLLYTSQQHQAVVQDVHFTQITWLQVQLLTV